MKYIKQYGIQRSGTNFMRAVFEMNTDCRVLSNIGGFKHGKIVNATNPRIVKTEISKEEIAEIDKMLQEGIIPSAVIVRNPYSWMLSIARYYNNKISKSFIDEQIKRYIDLNSHWAENCDCVIFYEELIENPNEIVNNTCKKLGITRTTDEVILPQGIMRRGGDIPATQNISKAKFTYRDPSEHLSELTQEQQEQIHESEYLMWFLKL